MIRCALPPVWLVISPVADMRVGPTMRVSVRPLLVSAPLQRSNWVEWTGAAKARPEVVAPCPMPADIGVGAKRAKDPRSVWTSPMARMSGAKRALLPVRVVMKPVAETGSPTVSAALVPTRLVICPEALIAGQASRALLPVRLLICPEARTAT
jgi:hypothetical protein